ncbi:MAG: hypothetical protein IJH41_07180 [Eubacterium sp.]|nr:hypothetical protein [Eubacterium sp.]
MSIKIFTDIVSTDNLHGTCAGGAGSHYDSEKAFPFLISGNAFYYTHACAGRIIMTAPDTLKYHSTRYIFICL